MEYKNYHKKKIMCANCGKNGHEFKSCRDPVTSFGIINIDISGTVVENIFIKDKFSQSRNIYNEIASRKYPGIKCLISDNFKIFNVDDNNYYYLNNYSIPFTNEEQIHKFSYYRDKIKFMMVSRKFSLGFVEFIRGKYDITIVSSIINLFEQMYQDEIIFIGKNTYDNILYHFLNRFNEPKEIVLNRIYEGKYSNEYCEAKIKFNMLADIDDNVNLYFYTKNIKPKWKKPEWGFPKGRRDRHNEENLDCACREFEEETGFSKNEYKVLNKIDPIDEIFIGTNGVHYKHTYYLSINECSDNDFSNHNRFDRYEIGEIKWFNFDDAMTNIRPYHTEKKRILTQVYLFILNHLISDKLPEIIY